MSRVISLRLKEEESKKLERAARMLGRSPGAAAALLLVEKLKEESFPFIEFRSTANGRHAFVKGTGMAVWEMVMVARSFGNRAPRVAKELGVPEEKVATALAYTEAYPEEIEPVLEEVQSFTFEDLKRIVPWAQELKA